MTLLPHTRSIEAMNAICVANGGAGGHVRWIHALNEWCTRVSVASGHATVMPAFNAIAGKTGGAASYRRRLDATNNIAADLSAQVTSNPSSFDALAQVAETYVPFALSSISPTSMVHDTGAKTLTFVGTHFKATDQVFMGVTELTPVTFVNNHTLTAVIDTDALSAGTQSMTVKQGATTSTAKTLTIT
jgi:hypothetical protein